MKESDFSDRTENNARLLLLFLGWAEDEISVRDRDGDALIIGLTSTDGHVLLVRYEPGEPVVSAESRIPGGKLAMAGVLPYGVEGVYCPLPEAFVRYDNLHRHVVTVALRMLPDVPLLQADVRRRMLNNEYLDATRAVNDAVLPLDWGRERLFLAVSWLLAHPENWSVTNVQLSVATTTERLLGVLGFALRVNARDWRRHQAEDAAGA